MQLCGLIGVTGVAVSGYSATGMQCRDVCATAYALPTPAPSQLPVHQAAEGDCIRVDAAKHHVRMSN